ncbi:MAG: hypothetical protein H7062_24135 [Candidatus Saccharimonas sp.]|nr:hypothetical protein [Planctomycetaceae bacterium]
MPAPGHANVQSLDALRDVRLALILFQERATSALGGLRTKIDRTRAWLEQDRPLYWRDQERKAYDGVASARVAYDTCRLRTVGGRHPECIEEKVALQRAKARLEFCQQKVDVVRRVNVDVSQQADDYRGRTGLLQRLLDEDVPNVLAMLSRMIDAIEAYAAIGVLPDDSAAVQLSAGPSEPTSEAVVVAEEQNGNEDSSNEEAQPGKSIGE